MTTKTDREWTTERWVKRIDVFIKSEAELLTRHLGEIQPTVDGQRRMLAEIESGRAVLDELAESVRQHGITA